MEFKSFHKISSPFASTREAQIRGKFLRRTNGKKETLPRLQEYIFLKDKKREDCIHTAGSQVCKEIPAKKQLLANQRNDKSKKNIVSIAIAIRSIQTEISSSYISECYQFTQLGPEFFKSFREDLLIVSDNKQEFGLKKYVP